VNGQDDLLQPTLTGDRGVATAIYSAQTGFYSAFLGGPVAALLIAGINAFRLGRLSRDLPLFVAAFAIFIAVAWWMFDGPALIYLIERLGNSGPHLTLRALGLVYFGVFFLLYRPHYRNMEMMGIEPPNGWAVGVPCTLAGFAVSALIVLFATRGLTE
jgi:MFS family permease